MTRPAFSRYVGIDYSGAATPDSGLTGLRVYSAGRGVAPVEVLPPPGRSRHWTRRGVAGWLIEQLGRDERKIVGIDHAFSFPLEYFERHGLPHEWPAFLDDFHAHWPTDEPLTVQSVRDGSAGKGWSRDGDTKWRRVTDLRAGGAKSAFHFGVPGTVAMSTHAGVPWLRAIRQALGARVHFWPFDGWSVPAQRSAVVEVYPSLWSHGFPRGDRTPDQHDAWSAAEWLRCADAAGSLDECFAPSLSDEERVKAQFEGWILGVM